MTDNIKEFNLNEMGSVAGGGDLLDYLVCKFTGHDLEILNTYGRFNENGIAYEYYTHWHCSNCGLYKYIRRDCNTHKDKEITRSEFKKYLP